MIGSLFVLAFGAAAVALMMNLVLGSMVLGRLRDEHPEKWREMGRPELLGAKMGPAAHLFLFVILDRARSMGDPVLLRYSRIWWFPLLASVVAGILVVVSGPLFWWLRDVS